jgi:outer membrane protein W
MKTLRNHIPLVLMVILTIAAISSFPRIAKAEEPSRWQIKTGVVLVDADEPFSVDRPSGGQVSAGGNAELGVALAVEYQWSELIGIEVGIAYAKSPDVDDNVNGNNDEIGEGPGFFPLSTGVNFHLASSENIDFYIGPRIAYVMFGDFDLDIDGQNTEFEVDDEFAWGATMGLNYRFGDSRWSLLAEATYLDVDMTISDEGVANPTTSSFDPLMVNLGLSYRF